MAGKLKLKGSGRSKGRSEDSADTASYQQPLGNIEKGVENRRLTRMPHERDESATATGNRLDQSPVPSKERIDRAVEDVQAGRKDTDRRGVPSDVPGPRANSSNAKRSRGR